MKRLCLSLLSLSIMAMLAVGQAPPTPGVDPKTPAPKPGETPPKTDPKPEVKLPDYPELKDAEKLFNENKFDECLKALQKAVENDKEKKLQPPEVLLAFMFVQAKKGSEARLVLERFIARNPVNPDGYLLNANFALNEGRVTDAVLSCYAAQNFSGQPAFNSDQQKRMRREARLGLVAAFETRGDFQSMMEPLQGLVNDDANNAGFRQKLATAKFQAGLHETAYAELKIAYDLDKTLDPPELRMAALWNSKGATKEKRDEITKELAENREKAEKYLTDAKANPAYAKDPRPHRAYAGFLMDDNKLDAALLSIDQAKKLDEENKKAEQKETKSLRALYHRYKKEYAKAVPIFEELYKANANDAFSIGNLAICLMELGGEENIQRAIGLGSALVQGYQRSAEAYSVLGWIQFRAAQAEKDEKKKKELFEAAEKTLSAAASSGQLMLDTAYYLAESLTQRKSFPEACRD